MKRVRHYLRTILSIDIVNCGYSNLKLWELNKFSASKGAYSALLESGC